MREWLQKIFVYSVLHYFFVYFRFVSTSFYFMKLSSCVVWFTNISNSPNQIYAKSLHALKTFPNFSFVWLHRKIIWHLDKVSKQVNRETAIDLALSPCVWGLRVSASPLVYSLKRTINYFCRICTNLCMIFKKRLPMEALCRPLFTNYAHCKPLFPFENNE